jgi:hypothetical protein
MPPLPTSRLTGIGRLGAAFAFLASASTAGWLRRSPWIVALLTITFTLGYIAGKWRAWRPLLANGDWRSVLRALPLTMAIQAALVTLLYLAGLGASSLAGGVGHAPALTSADWIAAGLLATIGSAFGIGLSRIERERALAQLQDMANANGANEPNADFTVQPEPVTPANFFTGIHYTHGSYNDGEFDGAPSAESRGGDEAIAEAERRLGKQLPEGLRRIYRVQNGGSVGGLAIAKVADPRPVYDDWFEPFSGYSDLLPLEKLRTVHDSVTDYADPDDPDQADSFPDGAAERVVLAQWYRETLFLDYRLPGEPRVGFTNFDDDDAEQKTIWFADFDAFFALLRRTES